MSQDMVPLAAAPAAGSAVSSKHPHRAALEQFLTSKTFHWGVVLLVVVDLACVMTDLGLTLAHCEEVGLSHAAHIAIEALSYASIAILVRPLPFRQCSPVSAAACLDARFCVWTPQAVMLLENLAQILVFGRAWLTKWLHVLDVVVVVASFSIEIVLRNSELREVAGLLVMFR